MRFIGHTMGTPDNTVTESIGIFARMGLDGSELVCRDGSSFHSGIPAETASELAGIGRQAGCPVVTLTPYAWNINSADVDLAGAEMQELCRAVDLAVLMGAEFVRAYGGKELPDDMPGGLSRTVAALKRIGSYAGERGIAVLVENHPGTMTRTGTATREVIEAVGLDSVRALYDPANVLYDTREDWRTTYDVQRGCIGYVHVKDYDDRSGRRRACNVGDGVVPWDEILACLAEDGYSGDFSFEYEKKWYPDDLTDASIGMRASFEFVKEILHREQSR